MSNDLNLVWDKEEQEFIETMDRLRTENAPKQADLADYFTFLSEMGADAMGNREIDTADQKFVL